MHHAHEEYGCETSGLVAHGVHERGIDDDDEEDVEEVLQVQTVAVSLLHCLVCRQLVGCVCNKWGDLNVCLCVPVCLCVSVCVTCMYT